MYRGGQARGHERALAGPVVVHVAVDCAEVVRKVNVDTHGDHSDESQEQRVYGKEWLARWSDTKGNIVRTKCPDRCTHTEDEFLRRSQHVDGEGDLVLVDLQSHPADKA